MSTLVVFEDPAWAKFEIVAALRGVFDLRCGGRTLLERFAAGRRAPELVLVARSALDELLRETHAGATVRELPAHGRDPAPVDFVNGRLLALGGDLERLLDGADFAIVDGDALVAARCARAVAVRLVALLRSRLAGPAERAGGVEPIDACLARELPELSIRRLESQRHAVRDGSLLLAHAWDLVRHNGRAIVDDFRRGPGAGIEPGALLYPGVHLVQDGSIRIGPGCRLKPGAVLDAEDGPITLEDGVLVQPHVSIRGPAHIGPRCVLQAGSRVREGTSLGPVCKIGGEVEESVVQGYSNKQHEGFLGHAYLGEWVNLGAGTNNSDLKNNYSSVRLWEGGRSVDSGLLFLGLIAADHVKSAIGTVFNTGTVVGLASQLFGAGFPPKFVPPFSWGGATGLELYDPERALATARIVMQRREVALSPAYERVFRSVAGAWRDHDRSAARW